MDIWYSPNSGQNLLPILLRTDDSGEVELMEAGFTSSGWARQDALLSIIEKPALTETDTDGERCDRFSKV